ncbi:hypothetical protein DdX_14620 [Ditylenchus destructor]|uniref:Uncharacterized protein n=1 Tax=Ditylenchus destructor TaxID=166010 RepID=A0AAD4MTW9_9BILA|nr:hypothetical protein DdX_14620 [Ditylenchus destructor]
MSLAENSTETPDTEPPPTTRRFYADDSSSLSDAERAFLLIEPQTKNIIMTLRIWDGPLPAGRRVWLFPQTTVLSDSLNFTIYPPKDQRCLTRRKKARINFGGCEMEIFWDLGSSNNVLYVDKDHVQVPKDSDSSFALVSITSNIVHVMAGNCLEEKDVECDYNYRRDYKNDKCTLSRIQRNRSEQYSQDAVDFAMGNVIDGWNENNFARQFNMACVFRVKFDGESYKIVGNDSSNDQGTVTDWMPPGALRNSTIEPSPAKGGTFLPADSNWASILLGGDLLLCFVSLALLLSAVIFMIYQYFALMESEVAEDDKPDAKDAPTQPQQANAENMTLTKVVTVPNKDVTKDAKTAQGLNNGTAIVTKPIIVTAQSDVKGIQMPHKVNGEKTSLLKGPTAQNKGTK